MDIISIHRLWLLSTLTVPGTIICREIRFFINRWHIHALCDLRGCQRLRDDLVRMGLDADCIHGDIPQQKREKTMRTFKDGKLPILIATDVASRGIDVDDVDCVINYDVPEENEYYIHRIGRTGRARKKGIAVSILGTFPEQAKLAEIAKYSHYAIQPVKFAEDGSLVEEEPPKPKKAPPRRRFR